MENQQPVDEVQVSQKKEWYRNWWGILIIIFLLPFFAIWYVWAKTNWNKAVKSIVTVIILVAFFSIGAGNSEPTQENNIATESNKKTRNEQPQTAEKPAETVQEAIKDEKIVEQPIEPFEIVVASQIVKKVDGKFRYFFDIRNKDKKDFNGEVSITLYNEKQDSALGKNTFETKTPLAPEFGNSAYIDINTGPISQHGELGITKFKYEVKIDNRIVKSGEGKITDKYEDSSMYGL